MLSTVPLISGNILHTQFEEPCPQIEWVGALKREKKFVIDKSAEVVPLAVYNPGKLAGTFEEMAVDGRLEHVHVWYRELGGSRWKKALLEDLTQIDFANINNTDWKEDKYGFAMIPWDFAKRLTLNDDGKLSLNASGLGAAKV